jgi:hypothetical protein
MSGCTMFCSLHSLISLCVCKDHNFPILCAFIGTQHNCLRSVFELNHHLVYTIRSFIRYVHFFYFSRTVMYFLRSLLTNTPSCSSLLHAVIQPLMACAGPPEINFLPFECTSNKLPTFQKLWWQMWEFHLLHSSIDPHASGQTAKCC